jgi:hypothetical protein
VAKYRFQIGAVFPADDPVARFVTVLAMMSNCWHRSMRAIDTEGFVEDDNVSSLACLQQLERLLWWADATNDPSVERPFDA